MTGILGALLAGGGAAAYSAAVSQFFDRLLTPPVGARATLYVNLIDGLVSDGVWSKLDVLDIFAAADSATALVNLKSSSFQPALIVASGSPTFTVDRGFSGCGAPNLKSVDLSFNPSTAGGNYLQNDAMFAGWKIGTNGERKPLICDQLQTGALEIWPQGGGNTYFAVNTNGTEVGATDPTPVDGFWLAQRTASNAQAVYQNDVLFTSSATASAALINDTLVTDQTINTTAMIAIGGSLTSGQRTALYTRTQTFLVGVGAV